MFIKKDIKKKTKSAPLKPLKSTQDTIPYVRVCDDENTNGGIIILRDGVFSKSYLIPDTNYSDLGEDGQEDILAVLEKIFNTFNHEYTYQLSINKRTVDQESFNQKVLMNYKEDGNDEFRRNHNALVLDKMQEGNNNLKAEKYLTVSLEASSVREALDKFRIIERDLSTKFKTINRYGLEALSLKDRLEILHDIFNRGMEGDFSKTFDLNNVVMKGLTTKDVIAPTGFNFSKQDHFLMGDTYVRVFFLKNLPPRMNSTVMEALTSIPTNVLVSAFYDPQPQEKAVAFASAKVTNIGGEVIKAQKNLSKSGAASDLISPKLDRAQRSARQLLADLTESNETLFHVTLLAAVFAETKEDLELYSEQLITRGKEYGCTLGVLNMQQEKGFKSVLPLGFNYTSVHNIMTTKDVVTIQPFSTQELQVKDGIYYGLNQLSKNLIIYNRNDSENQNGVILGTPGTGKSFTAKAEMYQVYLNTDNSQIFIIDPEREYFALGKELGATIFKIAAIDNDSIKNPDDVVRLNPLDLDISEDGEGSPFAEKVSFVISLVEKMLGGQNELNGVTKSIIDMTLQELYAPYIASLKKRNITIDTETCPTLKEFYHALKQRKEPQARDLADAIRMYCVGSQDLFAYRTNVTSDNRMVIYDIKNITGPLKEIGMQVCMNDVWNHMVSNKKKNVRTYMYADEFHIYMAQKSVAEYMCTIWRRARKWMGTPTAITQNVEDLVNSPEGRTILSTSDFAILLSQKYLNRVSLAEIFNITEEQQNYIANGGSGAGLIVTPKALVPFENHFPTDSPIYTLLSTKPKDSEMIS